MYFRCTLEKFLASKESKFEDKYENYIFFCNLEKYCNAKVRILYCLCNGTLMT